MPCRDDYPEERPSSGPSAATRRLDMLTRFMCQILTNIENELGNIDPILVQAYNKKDQVSLTVWWEKHKKNDKARELREEKVAKEAATRQSALDKLTKEEKKALGIR